MHSKCSSFVESLRAESLYDELLDVEPLTDFITSNDDLTEPQPESVSTSATSSVIEIKMEQNFAEKATTLQEIKHDFELQIEEAREKNADFDVKELESLMLKKIEEVEIAIDFKQKKEIEEVKRMSFS